MKLAITGTPGTGKSKVAEGLSKRFKLEHINEKAFCLQKGIWKWDPDENELVIPLNLLKRDLVPILKKTKDFVVEGHLICEFKLPIDYMIVLRVHPEILEVRLEKRGYAAVKVQDNVFTEGIDYCKKHAVKHYPKKKVIEIQARKTIKATVDAIVTAIGEREIDG